MVIQSMSSELIQQTTKYYVDKCLTHQCNAMNAPGLTLTDLLAIS
jgi:hypothetical protein